MVIAIIIIIIIANPNEASNPNEVPMKKVTYYSITTSTILYKTKYGKNFLVFIKL